ncbi:MAG: chromosome segregation protein SMC [bacterium]|nr:chromosome segregation protein SMC [bacterium]
MYLRRLDIIGFKSFANKTTVRFATGVTAIVGPNGCGKTNILDSLRWVLGEQRPTMLRGGKMEEVIFNGTRDLKPLGMSEVTLTVINDRGVLPTEYHEVQITRRLFRSGESEYLMNKVPCRLRDIQDLFADTGMGAHSYSVIQQDMIDSVISDKAEERRFLFEEAAGITKYKQRKKAALRKLEQTENDFLRLKDIYAEVKTQVNSLYRQQKKAERYQKILDDVKGWELFLSSSRVRLLDQEKRQLRGELDSLTDQRLQRSTELDQITLQLETDRKEQLDIERQLNELAGQVYSLSEEAHTKEREISVLREKRSSATALIERNTVEIEALQTRVQSMDDQLVAGAKELAELQLEYERVTAELADAEKAQSEADQQLIFARSSREDENRKLIEIESRLSSGKTEEHNLREQETELAQQIEQVEKLIADASPRQQELLASFERQQQTIAALYARKSEIEQRQTTLTLEIEGLIEQSEELALEISNTQATIEACEARKHLLTEMMVHYEGHESGLVAAMNLRGRWPGIVGTVAEKLVPVEGLELALEAALGNLAGFMICRDRSTAEEIIAFLKSENKGRVGILVPDSGIFAPAIKRPEVPSENFVGWLEGYVSTDAELRPLVEAVLSRVAVFKAGTNPSDILERLPYGFSAVSTDGILYGKNQIVGGSDDRFPLFRRKEKVEEQENLIREHSHKLEHLKERRAQTTARIAASRAESSTLVSALEALAEELDGEQKASAEIEFQRRTLTAEFERWERERNQARAKLEAIQGRQYSLGLDFNQLAGIKTELVNQISQHAGRLGEYERLVSESLERSAKCQIRVVESRSRLQQTESRIGHLKDIKHELDQTRDTKSEEIVRATADIALADERSVVLELELKETFERREQMQHSQESLRGSQGEILGRITGKEQQVKEISDGRDALNEQMHEREIRLNTIDSETRTLSERIREEYGMEIESVEASRPDENLSDDAARQYLHEQKEQLRKFGAVNLLALEEYRTASEREKFLAEQLNDLTTARTDLQQTIQKINITARELFMETFEKARVNFKNLFQELFNGGESDIMLEDPNDPLESNIDIIARPRGKKLLSITMMSGGERALTAISLLFALYLVKPSPFCILDEIDAPLDDANCHRFLKIIRKFSSQTQFITITHNKITMEAADNLYGVTMEQPGVSKLVSVKFSETSSDDASAAMDIAQPELEPAESEGGNGHHDKPPVVRRTRKQKTESEQVETAEPTGEVASPDTEDIELPPAIAERMESIVTISEDEQN